MANNKKKVQKLSKTQLKKLKGGLVFCELTKCTGDTCGRLVAQGASQAHCADSELNTVSISKNPNPTPQKSK